jgi:hypothetical protein
MGSCFSENMAGTFHNHYLHFVSNPFGILFDPFSISRALEMIVEKKEIHKNDLIFDKGFWHSPYHHGSFSGNNPDEVISRINFGISNAHEFIKKSNLLIVTFGTAFGWRHTSSEILYANCHKLPGNHFHKIFMHAEEILSVWKKLINKLKSFNPDIKLVFSVSPVRYIRDGLVQNNRSKAALISAVHELCKDEDNVYFPSYEIVIDVLRDYRFYKEDMVHPSDQAVKYIWSVFKNSFFEKASLAQLTEIYSYHELKLHRPIRDIEYHLRMVDEKRRELNSKFPGMNWSLDENA